MSEWKMVKLGEVLEYEQPTKYIVSNKEYKDSHPIPVLTAGKTFILGYTNDKSNVFSELPVIIFDDFTTAIKYVDFPFKVKSSAMKILKPVDSVSLRYLYYFMNTISVDTGLHKRYWISKFANIQIPLPLLETQNQIAAELDKITSLIEKRKSQLEKLDLLIKSKFIEMFDDILQHASKAKLAEIAKISGGLTKNSKRNQLETKMKYLRVANVYFNRLDLTEIAEIGVVPSECEKYLVKKNDILIVEGNGSVSQIGRAALWNGSIEPILHQNHLIKVRVDETRILPVYCLYYLIMPVGRIQIVGNAVSTTGLNTLSVKKIEAIEISVPALSLQSQFAAFVQKIEQVKVKMQVALLHLETLYKERMQCYFEGNS